MKAYFINLLIHFTYCVVVSAQSPGGPLVESWNGRYSGTVGAVHSILTLQQHDQRVEGTIDAEGYIYNLSGTLAHGKFDGELTDPQTRGRMKCDGSHREGTIVLTVHDAGTGQSFSMTFSKGTPAGNVAGPGRDSGTGNTYPAGRDPGLIGSWLYTESYSSGDYSFASQWRLIVNADGTYLYGDAKIAGGGSGVSASSGGGGYTRGQWKTENSTIYINEGNGWQPYAGYYLEGNSMLLKFSDGNKQVWKRN